MKITLIKWAGVSCAFVWRDLKSRDKFLRNLARKAEVRELQTCSLEQVENPTLRKGWERSANECGACWALGLSAVKF